MHPFTSYCVISSYDSHRHRGHPIRWWAKHHLEAIFRFLLFSVKNYLERISLSQISILGLRLLLS